MSKKKKSFAAYILIFWLIVLLPIGVFFLLMYAAANSWVGFDDLPTFEQLENPKSNLASEVYTMDSVILGKYFYQNRVNVAYEDLDSVLIQALIATEDERYYKHSGVDLKGLARAVVNIGKSGGASTITQQLAKMLFSDEPSSKWNRIKQKLQEWIIAARLERRYTKEEIITMYFNRFDFVNKAVGIKSATEIYFSTSPDSLKIEEAATLVGMLKNPSLFNPLRFPDKTTQRRNVVLYQMKRNKEITDAEYDSLRQLPLGLKYLRADHRAGVAPYFREVLRAELRKILEEKDAQGNYVLRKPDGEPYDIYKDGLRIYTTLDYKLQQYAEWAVKQHLGTELQQHFFNDLKKKKNAPFDHRISQSEITQILNASMKRSERYLIMKGMQCENCGRRGRFLKEVIENGERFTKCLGDDCGALTKIYPEDQIISTFNKEVEMKVFSWTGEIDTVMTPMDSIRYYKSILQSGLMSMDPHTGYIKAWVGGIDYEHFAFDHVKQSRRQVGSTFKPFVYAVAIDEGYSPCHEVPNIPITFRKGEYGLLQDWTPKNSDNDYGYNVTLKYGLANSLNTVTSWVMKQFGPQRVIDMAQSMGIEAPLDPVPALALGVADISVYEMTGAFSTFANAGVWTKPIFITHIEDKNGNIIKQFIPESREAMSEETAYVMLNLLEGVVDWNYNKDKGKSTGGTGIRLRLPKTKQRPYVGLSTQAIAGKTGTTQNNSDGWFIGITPDLVTGVWVGAEDRSVRFSTTYYGQGANSALPIWGYYMNKVYEDSNLTISRGDFERPKHPISIELDCKTYSKGNSFDNNEGNIFD